MLLERTTRGRAVLLTGCALLVLAGACQLFRARTLDPPAASAELAGGVIQLQGLERTYVRYVPAIRRRAAPLVMLLHGSKQTTDDFRRATGYAFERLADQHGFIVAYPQGFRRRWNDCRATGRYPARRRELDDVHFVLALIDELARDVGVDRSRVFVAGYSSGGQLAFRLAREHPERVAAIAAFSAHLPTPENDACPEARQPVSALLVSGTSDPINPFEGGEVTVFGFRSRGNVLSARASAARFAHIAGLSGPERMDRGTSFDEVWRWRGAGGHEVMLVVVHGGGHVVPGPHSAFPRILGEVSSALDVPGLTWDFFARQPPLLSAAEAQHEPAIQP